MKKTRYLLIAGILLLDQIVKYAVRAGMELGETIPVIKNVFHLPYVQNLGAAFNMFDGMQGFLTMVPLIALVFAVWYMEKHLAEHVTQLFALILIISGGLGNLIDRIWLGFVTDMFDCRFIDFQVFNIADIAICVGCFFLVVFIFFFDKPQQGEKADEQ